VTTEPEHSCFLALYDNRGPKKASGNRKITDYTGITNPTWNTLRVACYTPCDWQFSFTA